MPRSRPTIAGLFVVALLSSSVPAIAGQSVPIKGTLTSENTVDKSVNPFFENGLLYIGIDGSGTGNVSHLGKTTAQLDFDLGFILVNGVPEIPEAFFGNITFTAANGDLLYATFVGSYESPGSLDFTATITFKGGTGRFQDATGTATLEGADTDASGAVFTSSFEGTISY